MRTAEITRNTAETQISLSLNIDGDIYTADTPLLPEYLLYMFFPSCAAAPNVMRRRTAIMYNFFIFNCFCVFKPEVLFIRLAEKVSRIPQRPCP